MRSRSRWWVPFMVAAGVASAWPAHAQLSGLTPPAVDLRPLFYPVKDQLYRGSCAVFAALGAMEALPGVPRLSEAYAYAVLKADDLQFDGSSLPRMKQFLEQTPMIEMTRMPYENFGVFGFDEKNPTEVAIARLYNARRGQQAVALRDEAFYRAAGITVVDKPFFDIAWIKRTLALGKPIIAAMSINGAHWSSLDGKGAAASLEALTPLELVKNDGGHAIVLVGYDAQGYLLFRNSWGLKWGEQGYARMHPLYFMGHVMNVMTIDRVELVNMKWMETTEVVRVKATGFATGPGRYVADLSVIFMEPHVAGRGVTGVTYEIHPAHAQVSGSLRPMPVATVFSSSWAHGYVARVANLPFHSMKVCMTLHHHPGYPPTVNLCQGVPEIIGWSSAPIVDMPLFGARPATNTQPRLESLKLSPP